MSATNTVEDMEVDDDMNQASAQRKIQQHPTAADKPAADEDEALIVLSLKWIIPDGPQKLKRPESSLQKMFQIWFNKCKRKPDCSVEKILTDGRVVIKVKPAPAVTELQKLIQQTLTGEDGSSVTVTSVSMALPPPGSDTQTPAEALMNLPPSLPQTDEDEDFIVLSLKWINPDEPQKIKMPESHLEKMLQVWFNKCKRKVNCSVKKILTDGRAVIKVKPAQAITELQKLSQQTLTGRDGRSVTVTSVSLISPGFDTQTPADASMNLPPSLPHTVQVQPQKQRNVASAAGEMLSCPVPVGLFWYVNHMYEEELKRIEEVNGVKIRTEVKFEVDQKDGSPDKALDEFIDLIQTHVTEFSGSVIPLKFIDPDQWRDALKTIQTKENKLLVTLTSKGMSACGPKYSQDVIRKVLCGDAHQKRKPSASSEEFERETEDTSLKINLTSKDRLPDEGLIMEESSWKLMSTFHKKPLVRIKDKFNVELQESDISQGKVVLQHDDEDEALIIFSLKWINPDEPQKMKRPESSLEKMFRSWFNKYKPKVDCSVKKILTDGRAVIKIKPAPAVTELQKLSQQTLTGKDGSSVTVTSVSLTLPPPGFDIQTPADASVNLSPSMPQTVQVQPQKQRNAASAAGEMLSCPVPVGLFWYVNHMYEEELKRIEEVNGVKIREEMKVKFEINQKDGRPDKALDEFIDLIQTRMTESSGSVIPLKFIDPDQWREALKTIKKKENKLLVTLTSKGMTACGPKYSQDVISKMLFGDQVQHTNTNASLHEYERELTQAHWRPPQSANRKHNADAPHGGGATAGDGEEEKCPICLDSFKNKKQLKCKHEFCEECLQQAKDASGPTCPVCRVVFGKIIGDQPDGKMSHGILYFSLPGFPRCNTIVINYEIPSGKQTERHPNPGRHFLGISRSAYLPNNTEGNEVLQLLKRAFDQRLIFTVGTSRTTGMNGQVTWNDIPHKTSTTGGPESFGYPDPEYLSRVKEELKAKGIE